MFTFFFCLRKFWTVTFELLATHQWNSLYHLVLTRGFQNNNFLHSKRGRAQSCELEVPTGSLSNIRPIICIEPVACQFCKKLMSLWKRVVTSIIWLTLVNVWGKLFKVPQLTHESFLTLHQSCKIFFDICKTELPQPLVCSTVRDI